MTPDSGDMVVAEGKMKTAIKSRIGRTLQGFLPFGAKAALATELVLNGGSLGSFLSLSVIPTMGLVVVLGLLASLAERLGRRWCTQETPRRFRIKRTRAVATARIRSLRRDRLNLE